ncbi:hypothetical protein [Streptomyces specialis]|nr:hypothetical protein [Streptomyces specialis]
MCIRARGRTPRGEDSLDPTSMSQAAPRLDSLEEKLARIERSFG